MCLFAKSTSISVEITEAAFIFGFVIIMFGCYDFAFYFNETYCMCV